MAKLSVSVIGYNEERSLAKCLESVKWADELVFVDCSSTDGTAAVARRFTEKVFSHENDRNLNVNKQFGIDKCSGDWILYLDPDEAVTESLRDEIRSTIEAPGAFSAFLVPRRNNYFGRWLKHGGKYPDEQLRLFRKGAASFACKDVHERLSVQGGVGRLSAPLDHYPYADAADIVRKTDFYSSLKAEKHLGDGKPFPVMRGARRFLVNYFLRAGFLDGWQGFAAAVTDLFSETLARMKYNEKAGR
ncbi:MAG: hypothetical protein A3J79_02910 [Elusimicrobia bacterium RIFOXYB2_FULL_62_6]|nr:MAG: hypothetical protein A3J79_02910 [Elusimicrobia bacterium RIFOXYB2_FULL_62_6]